MAAVGASARKLQSTVIAAPLSSHSKSLPFQKRNPLNETISPCKPVSNPKEEKGKPTANVCSGFDMRNATLSSTSTQKGLQNKKQGRFDQLWMVKWFDWYKYVIAMTRKAWDLIRNVDNKLMSQAVRAESAKIAHSS